MVIDFLTHQRALDELKKKLHIGERERELFADPIDELIKNFIYDAKKHGSFSLETVHRFVGNRTTIWLPLFHKNVYDSMLERIAEEYEKELSQAIKPALEKWNSNKELCRIIDPSENHVAYVAALFRHRDEVASQISNKKALQARCR